MRFVTGIGQQCASIQTEQPNERCFMACDNVTGFVTDDGVISATMSRRGYPMDSGLRRNDLGGRCSLHARRNAGDAMYAARVMVVLATAEVIRAVSLVVKWAMAPPTAQPMGMRAIAMV